MLETAAILAWHFMAFLSAVALLLGAALCAVHLSDPEGWTLSFARRARRALMQALSRLTNAPPRAGWRR
jgi:predicted LPLAT superfamily acyltransferase